MPATLRELRERFSAKSTEARGIVTKAEDEDRGLSPEERSQFDGLVKECDSLNERIATVQALADKFSIDKADEANDLERRELRDESRKSFSIRDQDPDKPLTSSQRMRGFKSWLSYGKLRVDDVVAHYVSRMGLDYHNREQTLIFDRGLTAGGEQEQFPKSLADVNRQLQQRATNVTTSASLGGNVVPDEMMAAIDIATLAFGGMRTVSTVITTAGGNPLPIPTLNDTGNVGEIIAEDSTHNDLALTFGQVSLGAYKYSSKIVPISIELLQDSAFNMASMIGTRIGERIARITNQHFTTGTGTGQPRGITIDTTASGVTAGTANVLTFAEVNTLLHSVDPSYRQGAVFMGHDTIIARVQQMVDSQSRPIYMPNLVAGQPSTFLGYPLIVNQALSVSAAGKGLLFGDFSKYWIRDAMGMTFIRLDERYAEFSRVAFLAIMRCDGRLIDAGTHPVKHLILL